MAARTPTGELVVLHLGRAVRLDRAAVLADDPTLALDLRAMARETRFDAGQDVEVVEVTPDAATVAKWRREAA